MFVERLPRGYQSHPFKSRYPRSSHLSGLLGTEIYLLFFFCVRPLSSEVGSMAQRFPFLFSLHAQTRMFVILSLVASRAVGQFRAS